SDMEMVGNPAIRQAMRRIEYAAFDMLWATPEQKEDRQNYLRWTIECLADEMRLTLEASWGVIPKPDPTSHTLESREELPSGCSKAGEPKLTRLDSCNAKAIGTNGRPLAGRALKSFVEKCTREVCEPKALDSNGNTLIGAAKASFMKMCQSEA